MISRQRHCRIAIVGAQRARVAKVLSLIHDDAREIHCSGERCNVTIEYLPCVAKFDSYENEDGEMIRYLASMEYHGLDGTERGSSLAPFFDAEAEEDDSKLPTFPGVSAVAIGCGIEAHEEVNMIEALVRNLSGQNDTNKYERRKNDIAVKCIAPNPGYTSMKQENEAYKELDAGQKEEAAHLQSMGPGKMAKFVFELAHLVIDRAWRGDLEEESTTLEGVNADIHDAENDASADIPLPAIENEIDKPKSREIDPTKVRYACRMCRKMLFGQDDLEDPPHVPAQHNFTRRHAHGSNQCGSLFMASGLDWMGDMSPVEGKFSCPHCACKLGTWKWAGAQCSCGTWVTPAIQVPASKVDKVTPEDGSLPPGTIVFSHHVDYPP